MVVAVGVGKAGRRPGVAVGRSVTVGMAVVVGVGVAVGVNVGRTRGTASRARVWL